MAETPSRRRAFDEDDRQSDSLAGLDGPTLIHEKSPERERMDTDVEALLPESGPFSDDAPTINRRITLRFVSPARKVDTHTLESELGARAPKERYNPDWLLGEGGMGRVWAAEDQRIGRGVAMKIIRSDLERSPEALGRFIREARVQAQLEHPAIVPVYDLGVDDEGRPYFTMRRVYGRTLDDVLEEAKNDHISFQATWSRRRLLTAFSNVCLAVHFAHEADVLHRDLKPSNLMFGDYGEVYILDWGLARVGVKREDVPAFELGPKTMAGAPLGTPGYMSPEQMRGELELLGPATDVYSLGAILFEILTLEELQRPGIKGVRSRGVEARPSVRAPAAAVPSELEEIVVRATQFNPDDRFPSAFAMHRAIEQYLDGERGAVRRRAESNLYARRATAALTQAAGAQKERDRQQALTDVGRALELDPSNAEALAAFVRIVRSPPDRLPAEVEKRLEAKAQEVRQGFLRYAALAYASLFLYLPLFAWMGVRDWLLLSGFYGLCATVVFGCILGSRMKHRTEWVPVGLVMGSNIAFATLAPLFGPLLVMPSLLAINAATYSLVLSVKTRMIGVLAGCVTFLLVVTAGALGYVSGGYHFVDGQFIVEPGIVGFPPVPSLILLVAVGLATLIGPSLVVHAAVARADATERRLQLLTWQLRNLVTTQRDRHDTVD